jgi:hypothetical protein
MNFESTSPGIFAPMVFGDFYGSSMGFNVVIGRSLSMTACLWCWPPASYVLSFFPAEEAQ